CQASFDTVRVGLVSSLSRLTCQVSGLPSQEQGVKYVVNSDTAATAIVMSRDIVDKLASQFVLF
ncbi:hypothetical protein, partial [Corynebacterium sp. HMSC078H07]|uniref:hypothetical protein n=1 Tax=Corynebacterium sp. HMSC078H07 TaxID=1739379 RepID=UPI001AF01FA1